MPVTLRFMCVLLLSVGVWCTVPALADNRKQAPGARTSMELPTGFVAADTFSGFTNETLGASLVVLEMPAVAFVQIGSGLTADALASKGITDIQFRKLPRADDHIFLTGEQVAPGGEVIAKYMLVFRNEDATVLITANLKKKSIAADPRAPGRIEATLASAVIEEKPAPQKDLFTLTYVGDFKRSEAMMGQMRSFMRLDTPFGTPAARAHPLFIVIPPLDRRPVDDVDQTLQRQLSAMTKYSNVEIVTSQALVVDGLRGQAVTATAKERDDGAERSLYAVMLPVPGGGSFTMIGTTPAALHHADMAEFAKMALGFKRSK